MTKSTIELTGQDIGWLHVLNKEGPRVRNSGRTEVIWKCQCKCGKICYYTSSKLNQMKKMADNGQVVSCGCYTKQRITTYNTTHGLRYTRLNHIYRGMQTRCYNRNSTRYFDYGGRGIYICDEWYTPGVEGNPGFVNFYNWAIVNGYHDPRPDEPRSSWLTIERVDNDGPYAPWNCRWVSGITQYENRRNTKKIYDGEEVLIHAHFEDKYGWPCATLNAKLQHGWTPSAIVYAAKHPELGLYKMHAVTAINRGYPADTYLDKDGFIHMIPYVPQDKVLE